VKSICVLTYRYPNVLGKIPIHDSSVPNDLETTPCERAVGAPNVLLPRNSGDISGAIGDIPESTQHYGMV
jgi:hypothetical protein